MFSHLVQHLARFLPQGATIPASAPAESQERGWHESSWTLSRGAEVIELPPAAAATLFADTQPAFHGPSEETTLAA